MEYKITLPEVRKVVEDYFLLNENDINQKPHPRRIVIPRQLTHHWCVKNKLKNGWTLEKIGIHIGKKDHATVLHSYREIENMIQTKYVFDFVSIKDHVKHINTQIDAYITKQKAAPMGTQTETIRKAARAQTNNRVLSHARVAQRAQGVYIVTPALRKLLKKWQNSSCKSCRPRSAGKQNRSLRFAGRKISAPVR